jgi:hypothetical protein
VAAGEQLIAERPRTRADLSSLLAARWPDADPLALAYAVTFHASLVQVPPRGLWGASAQATWALAEDWLDAPLAAEPSVDALVLRYLAAFGPASTSDVRTWAGVTGLPPVIERLRPGLRSFRDERGREPLDLPRFLPEYDNVALSHADRSRLFNGTGPGAPFYTGKWIGTLLVDGFYRANWQIVQDASMATLTIDRLTPLADDPPDTLPAIEQEGLRLLGFVAPGAEPAIRFAG